MKLINADELKKEIETTYDLDYGKVLINPTDFADIVDNQPAVDAMPVRHGKWKVKYGYNVYGGVLLTCSECGHELVVSPQALEDEHYCSYCGAKMDK